MYHKNYCNFVKYTPNASSHNSFTDTNKKCDELLSGDQAKEIYLHEIRDAKDPTSYSKNLKSKSNRIQPDSDTELIANNLFVAVQNNDIDALKQTLRFHPERVNTVDEYGWSLLMIACQADSVEVVEELLNHGIDTSIRDKAGNSATSLVIKNKNYRLANILLKYKRKCHSVEVKKKTNEIKNTKTNDEFKCETCMNVFANKAEHLSSTVHNINASIGRKIPTNYVIPESNRGYQIMVRVGWDKETGLGRDGSGQKYPIKAVQKKDRKGLGHENKKIQQPKDVQIQNNKTKKILHREYHNNRRMEMDFRRQFY